MVEFYSSYLVSSMYYDFLRSINIYGFAFMVSASVFKKDDIGKPLLEMTICC